MKILVIGATGMIGSRIVAEALSRGHEVIAAARNPDQAQQRKGLSSIALDVSDTGQLAQRAALAPSRAAAMT